MDPTALSDEEAATERGPVETARRHGVRYAIATGMAERDPSVDLRVR